jgi:hypothetical protein
MPFSHPELLGKCVRYPLPLRACSDQTYALAEAESTPLALRCPFPVVKKPQAAPHQAVRCLSVVNVGGVTGQVALCVEGDCAQFALLRPSSLVFDRCLFGKPRCGNVLGH